MAVSHFQSLQSDFLSDIGWSSGQWSIPSCGDHADFNLRLVDLKGQKLY